MKTYLFVTILLILIPCLVFSKSQIYNSTQVSQEKRQTPEWYLNFWGTPAFFG